MSFVERVFKRESCLIILLKGERRYTRIALGFRSQGVEQFVRGDRGMFVRCFRGASHRVEGRASSLLCLTLDYAARGCVLESAP